MKTKPTEPERLGEIIPRVLSWLAKARATRLISETDDAITRGMARALWAQEQRRHPELRARGGGVNHATNA